MSCFKYFCIKKQFSCSFVIFMWIKFVFKSWCWTLSSPWMFVYCSLTYICFFKNFYSSRNVSITIANSLKRITQPAHGKSNSFFEDSIRWRFNQQEDNKHTIPQRRWDVSPVLSHLYWPFTTGQFNLQLHYYTALLLTCDAVDQYSKKNSSLGSFARFISTSLVIYVVLYIKTSY